MTQSDGGKEIHKFVKAWLWVLAESVLLVLGCCYHSHVRLVQPFRAVLEDSSEALKVSKVAANWKAYVDFVSWLAAES